MPKSISPAEWKKAVAEQKQRNKQLMEEKAAIVEEAPATEPVEAPEVAPVADEVEVAPAEVAVEPATEEAGQEDTADTTEPTEEPEAVANDTNPVVEEAEPEVQEEPVEEPVVATEAPDIDDVQKSLQEAWKSSTDKKASKTLSSIIYTRVDSNNRKAKPIFQPDFAKFCSNILLGGSMPEKFEINCTVLTKSNRISVWEEGGSSLGNGNVLLVTDAYGDPKEAVTAYHDRSVVCGRHALIPINLYDHLVIGVRNDDKKCIGIYRIDTITPVIPKTPVTAICTRVVLDEPRDEEHDDITIATADLKDYEASWICGVNPDDNNASAKLDKILGLAEETLYNEDASAPIYIKKYNKYRLNTDDYRNVVADKAYLAKMIEYNTVPEMYAAFEGVSEEYFNTHDGKGEDFVGVVTLQLYTLKSGKEIVVVYVSGLIYPKVVRSPKASGWEARPTTTPEGRVYYGRAIIREGDTFCYPDKSADDSVTYEYLVERLKRNRLPDGKYSALVTAFRCMC